MSKYIFILLLISFLVQSKPLLPQTYGILNEKAPKWEINQWYQLPEGKKRLELSDFKGKVIYLFCFQAWCPGCHKYGFPTLKYVMNQFKNDSEVVFIAIQTTFEGFKYNGFEQAKQVAKQYNLNIPIGQSGSKNERSKFMVKYRTGGTPWVIIIDKQGIVRYNNFHIHPKKAVRLIRLLKTGYQKGQNRRETALGI